MDRIIRQKIRTAEQIPVSWQKDRVWDCIKKREPRSHRMLVPYYAAASVLLVTSLVVYFVNRAEREQSSQKIANLETSILQFAEARPLQADQSLSMSQNCEPTSPPKTLSKQNATPARKNEFATLKPVATALSHPASEELVMRTETEVQVVQSEAESAKDTPRIEAIIGFIPPPQMKTVTTKVKEVKFKFLRGNDNPENGRYVESTSILTARIN